ncbi:transaldolase [Sulfurivermis fontis]|uniref:transaldolase n=1 Tax=Sulfurivermis fontis TaxID=1972068 RepID=UPI000FDAEDBA|nr:transaldolase [Sulfurivermis fontis]
MGILHDLQQQGQSVWQDYIERGQTRGGGLQRLIEAGVRGVTSNPSIFEKAIGGSAAYDEQIRAILEASPAIDAQAMFELLAVEDIREAADVLRPVFDASDGLDGYVSLEVSPHLAHDTQGTIAAAQRLWQAVDRPNLMIKVPATAEGIPAIEALLAVGINVNATLMFSQNHYEAVAAAYLRGVARCDQPRQIASVASLFISRVDSAVDKQLEAIGTDAALALRGRCAIANAKVIYQRFRQLFDGAEFAALRGRGARVQRPLWGSTGTKNPAYSDVLYVDELIGPDTVNTLPPATLKAFLEHGHVAATLTAQLPEARQVLAQVAALGIDLEAVCAQLQREGVKQFADAYDQLLATLRQKRAVLGN